MTVPVLNAALVVEIGHDACRGLMTGADWSEMIDRFLDASERTPWPSLVQPS